MRHRATSSARDCRGPHRRCGRNQAKPDLIGIAIAYAD